MYLVEQSQLLLRLAGAEWTFYRALIVAPVYNLVEFLYQKKV